LIYKLKLLAYLKVEDVQFIYDKVKRDFNELISENADVAVYLAYFEHQWISNKSSWNLYDVADVVHHTNNSLEGKFLDHI
jgi:hypothetical protein